LQVNSLAGTLATGMMLRGNRLERRRAIKPKDASHP